MSATRLLVISEDQDIRHAFETVARKRGGVTVAFDGDTVDDVHDVLEAALVVIDLDTSALDGIRLLAALSEHGSRVPVLLVGDCDSRTLDITRRIGEKRGLSMLRPLCKPADAGDVCRAVHSVVPMTAPQVVPADLVTAIERGQFRLHYQPMQDLGNGAVFGVEALLRWEHPDYGQLGPDRVIPVAEAHGLMGAVTRWVAGEAFEQYARWKQGGWNFRISINVSAEELRDPRFVDDIADLARRHGVPFPNIAIEITESRVIAEEVEVLETLARLRLLGMHLAIDDFGTGYSSLGRLRDMPFTEIKIDKSFVMAAGVSDWDREIVRVISMLGRRSGMTVVAEGVDSREALKIVGAMNCHVAQGFHISEPLPADELTEWLYDEGVPTGVLPPTAEIDAAPSSSDFPSVPLDVARTPIVPGPRPPGPLAG